MADLIMPEQLRAVLLVDSVLQASEGLVAGPGKGFFGLRGRRFLEMSRSVWYEEVDRRLHVGSGRELRKRSMIPITASKEKVGTSRTKQRKTKLEAQCAGGRLHPRTHRAVREFTVAEDVEALEY